MRKTSRNTQGNNALHGIIVPCDIEMEKTVLAVILQDSQTFYEVQNILTPECFYDPQNREIYKAMRELFINQKPIDILTIEEQLKRNKTEIDIKYIIELYQKIVRNNIEYYVRILEQQNAKRKLISLGTKIVAESSDAITDVEELVQDIETTLFDICKQDDYSTLDKNVLAAQELLMKVASMDKGLSGISSGLVELDRVTSGFQNGDLVLVAGRPAMGKTSFLTSLALTIAVEYKIPAAYYSMELSNIQLTRKFIANHCQINLSKMTAGTLSEEEWARLDQTMGKLYESPLFMDDSPCLTTSSLRHKIYRLIREHGVKIVFIDYLQLFCWKGRKEWENAQDLSVIMRELKAIAREFNIPIVVASQMNSLNFLTREPLNSMPSIYAITGGNEIGMYADVKIILHRPEYYHVLEDENGKSLRDKIQLSVSGNAIAKETFLLLFKPEYQKVCNLIEDVSNKGGEYIPSAVFSEFSDFPNIEDTPFPY